jgi:ferredoxin
MLSSSPELDVARSRLSCQIKVTTELEGLRVTVAPGET